MTALCRKMRLVPTWMQKLWPRWSKRNFRSSNRRRSYPNKSRSSNRPWLSIILILLQATDVTSVASTAWRWQTSSQISSNINQVPFSTTHLFSHLLTRSSRRPLEKAKLRQLSFRFRGSLQLLRRIFSIRLISKTRSRNWQTSKWSNSTSLDLWSLITLIPIAKIVCSRNRDNVEEGHRTESSSKVLLPHSKSVASHKWIVTLALLPRRIKVLLMIVLSNMTSLATKLFRRHLLAPNKLPRTRVWVILRLKT